MNLRQSMQALRITGFGLAVIAAVVVFIVGGVADAEAWRTPALILIGVLVVVLHFSTLPYLESSVSTEERIEYRVEYAPVAATPPGPSSPPAAATAPGAVAPAAGPVASAAPVVPMAGTVLPGVVIPTQAFPDAGRGHAPAMEARTADELPPLHHVLGSSPTNPAEVAAPPREPASPPVPTAGTAPVPPTGTPPVPPAPDGVAARSGGADGVQPDAVLVDLRSGEGEAHLVYQVLDGAPAGAPPPTDTAPPPVDTPLPVEPSPPADAPPSGGAPSGGGPGPVDPGWAPPDPGSRRT